MSTFDDRENAFEAKFAHDQEKEFRAEMMAMRQIAVWGGILDAGIARGKRTPHSRPTLT